MKTVKDSHQATPHTLTADVAKWMENSSPRPGHDHCGEWKWQMCGLTSQPAKHCPDGGGETDIENYALIIS